MLPQEVSDTYSKIDTQDRHIQQIQSFSDLLPKEAYTKSLHRLYKTCKIEQPANLRSLLNSIEETRSLRYSNN